MHTSHNNLVVKYIIYCFISTYLLLSICRANNLAYDLLGAFRSCSSCIRLHLLYMSLSIGAYCLLSV